MVNVVCGIIIENEQILITQRGDDKHLAGKWEFPGGKIEGGESEVASLKRELKEELNVEVVVFKKFHSNIHIYEKATINLISYFAKIVSGKIQLSEHKNYKFVSLNELKNFDFAEADLPIVEKLKQINFKDYLK